MDLETFIEIVLAFANAPTWLEGKRVVEQHRELLLSDRADMFLARAIARNQHNPAIQQRLKSCRRVLQDCREIGVDAAFVFPIGPRPGLLEALKDLLVADSPSSAHRTVIEHADLLLTDEADWTLVALAASTPEETLFVERVAHRRDLLARCRREGIDTAFADMLHDERLHEGLHALLLAENSLDEIQHVLEQYQDVLLTDEAEQKLAELQEGPTQAELEADPELAELQARPGLASEVARVKESLSVLLSLARTDGIQVAVRLHRVPPFERFLHRAFMALATREDASQEVIPDIRMVLETNLALLDEAFPARLRKWAAEQIDNSLPHEHLTLYVNALGHFAHAIHTFPLGSRADNLEIAIACCQAADTFCKRLEDANLRVVTLNNLGNLYMERVHESRAENIEGAIDCFQQALSLVERTVDPESWARVTESLGNAYVDRERGGRINDIETAIQLYTDALGAVSREQHPELWLSIHNDLGLAYSHRIRGESAENLERAIFHFEQALTALPHGSREERCVIYNNLALIYVNRGRGDPAKNIERAIHYGHEVLALTDRATAPVDWAKTQTNLGRAYAASEVGEQGENIERAIDHYQQALEVVTRASYPAEWARLQNNLGNNFRRRKRGDPDDNKRLAIQYIEQALEVYTHDAYPEQWARATSDLAAAHTYVPFHIYTGPDFEKGFAAMRETHAHYDRAIDLLQQALEVRSPDLLPWESAETAYLCGQAMAAHGRYAEARTAFEIAHRAIRTMRGEASRESAKRSLSATGKGIYEHLVRTCLRLGDVEAAFTYAAAGKGRAFTDLLASARFDLSAATNTYPDLATDLQRARTLRREIDGLLDYLSGETQVLPIGARVSPNGIENYLRELQAQEQTLWEDMAYTYPSLTATQQAPEITPADARGLAAALDATLVEFYPHEDGWSAFVVTAESIVHVPLQLLTEGFFNRLTGMVQRIGSRVGRGPLSYCYLEDLHQAVMAPLINTLPQDRRLFLAPYGALHMLPLAAARNPQTGQYAADAYRLAFAPSVAALWVAWQQARRTGRSNAPLEQALSVAYPGTVGGRGYLPNVISEAESVANHFAATAQLYGQDATPDAVITQCAGRNVLHLGCHGAFDTEHPEQSGLMLAEGWLTVRRILTDMKLADTQICTLGACVSGLARVAEGDEPVGLAHAMLVAGAQVVVASQWNVHDAATRMLFETFYADIAAGHTPADALHVATQAVRRSPQWQHPYYWAAFQVLGLAHLSTTTAVPVSPAPNDLVHEAQNPAQVPLSMNRMVRINAPMHAMTRGGGLMNIEQQAEEALSLLTQMSEYPNEVLAKLKHKTERDAVLTALDVLAAQANVAQSDADLLNLTDAIYRLARDQPGLNALFSLEEAERVEEQEQREVTQADHLAATRQQTYAQMYIPQIRNAVIKCHTQLEVALRAAKQADSPTHTEKKP